MTYFKNKRRHRRGFQLISFILTLLLSLCLVLCLGTGTQGTTVKIYVPDIEEAFDQAIASQAESLRLADNLSTEAEKVQAKKLNDLDLVAPEPNADGYGQVSSIAELSWLEEAAAPLLNGQSLYFSEEREQLEGSTVNYYLDDSIATVTWKEGYGNTVLTFAEVVIADGSQFRRFLSDGQFGAETQYTTTEMAKTVNAVLASSGDFYKFHYNGIVVYENTVRKIYTNKADTCFINDEGDMLFIGQDEVLTEEEAQRFVDENNVRFSLVFGPILVDNGERCEPEDYSLGEINSFSPRAALCQMGTRHYLLVTANAEGEHTGVITIHQFAERIAETGCLKAYALDGGQTAALALDGELVNHVLYGQQRSISDIIYFATSVGG